MSTTHGTASTALDTPPDERPHPLEVGHRLDEFELLEVIGEGGFGIVYRAYDHSLQREVAIKEYMPSMLARRVGDDSVLVRSERLTATFQAGLRSFINEARTLAQFSHPALVRVHRFWEANSTAYMAIQLYKGRTLRRLAEDEPGRINEAWLLGMLGPLLGALETLHRSQCFHRDIAPDNIFIQPDDLPVLLDFGAARKSIADLVDEVAVMVKSGYSPIEQYADDNTLLQGAWTDLYALGAVLYRAVTGHPPPSAVVRSVQDAYVPLSSMGRGDLSPGFCAAVDHTLAVHSKDRTQTVAAFAAELGLVKLGDIYVSGMGVPAVIIPAAPVSAVPPPPPLAPQQFSPMSAPVPLEPVPVAAVEAAPTPTAKKTQKAAARRPRWGLVGVLVIALVAVGWWIGMRLTSGMKQQDTTTAMVPVPPPASPMSSNTSPPAVMPAAPAADAGAPAAAPVADAVPPSAPAGTTVAGAAPAPAAGAPATPATGPLTPIENVPVNPPVTTPVDPALATAEAEDWSLAQAENTREGYEAYLRRYRRGPHARDARNAIAELNRLSPPTVPAAPDGTAAAPGMGRVVLNIRPWGQVFVDGADRGVSPPLKSLPLRPGIYNIEVRNGDLEVYRQRVTVQDSKSAPVVSHEFK
ncbi:MULTISPECIES: serine/threonine protein kinase [Variovorax]|jgi:non-specific serine/threonine protein kinase|uniref:serine/threonine protein kinase n=1 Tax=Variovorax TaxID=34072 RepID=UPI00086E8B72|nr:MULTISPECIES: serine/threonine-protein kinase [Variovorax]MBN8756934.1 serine/threonine protein kinase [Variovorax sp.]ODU12774.1 MAG: serine/threonine protein kinase [Variovorax sp. SCN 67-85]ODV19080.1 MAG: serine/threonine protein kinase [Variovorax sp. SCN 67-20]OJZ09604.1 MAG: serine/threonine protein kinase [Variovorax sp. 67-131]UKI08668.1 serine/threonine protein kinase [Variovorax paradoxus]